MAPAATLDEGLKLQSSKDRVAIVDLTLPSDATHWRYDELDQEIERLTDPLAAAGASPGDVVAFAMRNSLEFVLTFLAIARLGAVAAPLNPVYKEAEFEFYLADSKASYLLVTREGNARAEATAQSMGGITVLELLFCGDIGSTTKEFTLRWKAGRPCERAVPRTTPPSPESVCLVLHTSGTTSRPKAVPLTQNNLVASFCNIRGTYALESTDTSLLVMPLFHIHGLVCGLLAPLSVGATIVIPAGGAFSASRFWGDAAAHAITWFTAVPTILHVLLLRAESNFPRDQPPPLRFIRSCSSALPATVMKALEKAFRVPVLEAYAMTEASHQIASNPLPNKGSRVPGSVGVPQNVSVAILDSEGRELPAGETGEVCIRGANVTKGYLNNPEANEEAFRYRWFHTGDLGVRDANGYIRLVGRIKELINRGGEKISPVELDHILLKHPAVAEAVAFGGPDEKYGETVYCAVTVKPGAKTTEEELLQFCKDHVASFKVPKRLFLAETLPKTATGKIQRRHVAAHFLRS